MIYLLIGNKKERRNFIHTLCDQQGININNIQNFFEEDFNESFEKIIPYNVGLFGERECFVIHDMVRQLNIKDILKEYINTEHLIFFSEKSCLKKDISVFEKNKIIVKEFGKEEKEEIKKYNTFALADLLGEKNKKKLWLSFREAIDSGVSAEEIHGVLFWQLKNLALIKQKSTRGMNSFIVRKNEVFAHQWSFEDIQKSADKLTQIFHSRDSFSSLEIELEKFIFSLQ